MKKNLVTLVLCAFAFGLGFGLNNIAFSNASTFKVAYINAGKLLSSSQTVKNAEATRKKQNDEMLQWYKTASAEINKQQNKQTKDALIKKYEAQLTEKKKAIKTNYSKKMKEVDTQLTAVISQKAKAMGYDMVLRGDIVLFGGDDITASVLPLVK